MPLPSWINQVCPSPPTHLTWHQPAEVRSRDRRYAVRTDGQALFAWRIGPEDHGLPMPGSVALRTARWLRPAAPLRVSSAALLDFLMASAATEEGRAPVAVGIGENVYNARLLLRDLSQIEDMPAVLRLGETAHCELPTFSGATREFCAVLIAAPRWRYLAMPMRNFDAPCWRLEDAAEVRP